MQPDKYAEVRAQLNGRREMRLDVRFDKHEKRSDGSMTISGYGAVYNKPSVPIWGMFIETIAPGAFRKILKRGDDVQYLENHGGLPLARTSNGTLRLSDDPVGIRIEADLNPKDPQAVSLFAKVERGDVIAQSFCFDMDGGRDQWTYAQDDTEMDQRLILEFGHAYEFSAVGSPAYPDTTLEADAAEDAADGGADEDAEEGRSSHVIVQNFVNGPAAVATPPPGGADTESRQRDDDAQEDRGGDGEQPTDSGAPSETPDQPGVSDQAAAMRMRAQLAAHRSRRNHSHESRTEGRA